MDTNIPQSSKKNEHKIRKEKAQFRFKMKAVAWTLFIVAIIGGFSWISFLASQEKTDTNESLLIVTNGDYAQGPENAPATLIEYLDFECEACGAYFPFVQQLKQEFPNELRVVSRYFPLPGHRNGMTAALAVEAAARQGKFVEMHDLLFTEQEKWGNKPVSTPEVFEEYAKQLGLDIEKFKTDVASQSVKDRISYDVETGRKLKITGTPSFFLNGEKINNPRNYEAFKSLIQLAVNPPH